MEKPRRRDERPEALDRQRGPCVLSLNVRDAHKTLRDRFPVEHDPADVAEARLSS
jgi:hypothetical protein